MSPTLSRDDVITLVDDAEALAHRVCRKLALPPDEQEDVRQDLLLDLTRRLRAFDETRGSIGAFANIVLRHKASRIAVRIHRQRKAQGGTVLSLDVPVGGALAPLGDVLTAEDALATWYGQSSRPLQDAERRCDLSRALGSLPDDARQLAAALMASPTADIVDQYGFSRSTLYRRLARLRLELAMRGLGSRWDDLQVA